MPEGCRPVPPTSGFLLLWAPDSGAGVEIRSVLGWPLVLGCQNLPPVIRAVAPSLGEASRGAGSSDLGWPRGFPLQMAGLGCGPIPPTPPQLQALPLLSIPAVPVGRPPTSSPSGQTPLLPPWVSRSFLRGGFGEARCPLGGLLVPASPFPAPALLGAGPAPPASMDPRVWMVGRGTLLRRCRMGSLIRGWATPPVDVGPELPPLQLSSRAAPGSLPAFVHCPFWRGLGGTWGQGDADKSGMGAPLHLSPQSRCFASSAWLASQRPGCRPLWGAGGRGAAEGSHRAWGSLLRGLILRGFASACLSLSVPLALVLTPGWPSVCTRPPPPHPTQPWVTGPSNQEWELSRGPSEPCSQGTAQDTAVDNNHRTAVSERLTSTCL